MSVRLLRLQPLQDLLNGLQALRQRAVLAVLLGTLAMAGLSLASLDGALARGESGGVALAAGCALASLIYGVNAAGWLLMQQALGRGDGLDALDGLRAALGLAHRSLAVLALALLAVLPLLALLWAGLLLARQPGLGPWVLTVLAPLAVAAAGALTWLFTVILIPLTGPAIWSGLGVAETLRWLVQQARQHAVQATLLKLALLALVAGVGALLSALLLAGARVLAAMAWLSDLPVPPQQVLAHLFGHTLKALGQSGAPVVANAQAAALSTGGGVLLAFGLVLPMAVYLRGCCSLFLSLRAWR